MKKSLLNMKTINFYFVISSICLLTLFSCKEPEARLPISKSKSAQINKSIALNKALIEDEESLIKEYIAKDTTNQYLNSSNGFWYSYKERHLEDTYHPKPGDLVTFTYSVSDLQDKIIYTESEIGVLKYLVDQEDQLKGIRHAVKLLKKGEKASFIFPSHLAYGYIGDKNKIGKNQPIIMTIALTSIEIKN
ncbi:protein involved in gliding motility GldI [Myroides guanonis]|uniref:Peptidyl-prolyl cis-trans isomerase n=2 Tax=Myroides guanonis TaxID=1150112 RepID=A0A1I3UFL5_9FLAO|nr:protein involved in gliding motility GldI [Myroides guanonis]